jgi:hypothetical protein
MAKIEGGCLCGQVRYHSDAEPVVQAVCHCKNCQKQAGTAFSVIVGVPAASLKVEGEMKTYLDHGDSGAPVERRFCADCGSPILSQLAGGPPLVYLKAGTLDDTSWLDPKVHVWTRSHQAWLPIPEGVIAMETNPPG